MNDSPSQCSQMLSLLQQAGAGSPGAVDALLRGQAERLTQLARRMLWRYPSVKRWAETDDVLQNALLRLVRALQDVKPESLGEFFSLATLQIRRELIDLARHYFGPEGLGANYDSQGGNGFGPGARLDPTDRGADQDVILRWREFHRRIDDLPPEERQVVELLFYQGLSQAEATEVLQISLRTLQRRWHAALQKLHRVWQEGP